VLGADARPGLRRTIRRTRAWRCDTRACQGRIDFWQQTSGEAPRHSPGSGSSPLESCFVSAAEPDLAIRFRYTMRNGAPAAPEGLLERLQEEIRQRLRVLGPAVEEYGRLEQAMNALDASSRLPVRCRTYRSDRQRKDDLRVPARKLSVLSMFSGCGGFDLGVEQSRLGRLVWANDNDAAAVATYRRNFGSPIVLGDVRDLDPPDLAPDVLIAGPPCQDFSVLWLHEGALTARGSLYFEVLRFLSELAPPAFILENVRGLLSANRGQAWALIRSGLKSPTRALGFPAVDAPRYDLSVAVVNFADLGVPQIRERLIVIGTRADLKVPPIEIPRPFESAHRTARSALEDPPLPALGEANHELHADAPDVSARLELIPPGANYTAIPAGHPLAVKGLISHVYRRLDPDKPAYTMVAGGGGGSMGYHWAEPRSLTNRERARLQTFPDTFTFDGSIREIRAQVGNAVPPLGGQAIFDTVAHALRAAGIRPGATVRRGRGRSEQRALVAVAA
jgi:DNA (cytosine-5)-methyltransferase 1